MSTLLSAAMMHAEIACEQAGVAPFAVALMRSNDATYAHLTFNRESDAALLAEHLGLASVGPRGTAAELAGPFSGEIEVDGHPVTFVVAAGAPVEVY